MTPLTVHRRLSEDRQRAEHARARAKATREQLARSVDDLERELASRPLDPESSSTRMRLLQQLMELERFDRDVGSVVEELHQLAVERMRAFAAEVQAERRIQCRLARRPRLKRRSRAHDMNGPGRPRPQRTRVLTLVMTR